MSSETPMKDWLFLIVEWRGQSKDQFGGDGIIESCKHVSVDEIRKLPKHLFLRIIDAHQILF